MTEHTEDSTPAVAAGDDGAAFEAWMGQRYNAAAGSLTGLSLREAWDAGAALARDVGAGDDGAAPPDAFIEIRCRRHPHPMTADEFREACCLAHADVRRAAPTTEGT